MNVASSSPVRTLPRDLRGHCLTSLSYGLRDPRSPVRIEDGCFEPPAEGSRPRPAVAGIRRRPASTVPARARVAAGDGIGRENAGPAGMGPRSASPRVAVDGELQRQSVSKLVFEGWRVPVTAWHPLAARSGIVGDQSPRVLATPRPSSAASRVRSTCSSVTRPSGAKVAGPAAPSHGGRISGSVAAPESRTMRRWTEEERERGRAGRPSRHTSTASGCSKGLRPDQRSDREHQRVGRASRRPWPSTSGDDPTCADPKRRRRPPQPAVVAFDVSGTRQPRDQAATSKP